MHFGTQPKMLTKLALTKISPDVVKTRGYCLLEHPHTCLSAGLPGSQVDDRRAEGPCLPHPTTAVANHAPCMCHQLDELLKGHVLYGPEVRMLLNTLLTHHTHHLLTACGQKLHSHGHYVQTSTKALKPFNTGLQ